MAVGTLVVIGVTFNNNNNNNIAFFPKQVVVIGVTFMVTNC